MRRSLSLIVPALLAATTFASAADWARVRDRIGGVPPLVLRGRDGEGVQSQRRSSSAQPSSAEPSPGLRPTSPGVPGEVEKHPPDMSRADWPQFRGPGGNGVSPETGLLRGWPEAGPRILWTIDVGEGFAGAAIRDGQVYLLDRNTDRQDILRCLDLSDGKELWRCAYDAPGTLPYHGSRQVPTVTDTMVYSVGPFGHLTCIDRKTHEIIWKHQIVEEFKEPDIDKAAKPRTREEKLLRAQVPEWGVTQSPAVYGDLVIVAPQTEKVGLAGYDKTTGSLKWTSVYVGRNWFCYVSPTLMKLGGVDQVVMLGQPSDPEKSPANAPPAVISGVDVNDGCVLWQIKTPRPYKIPIPQPVQVAEDRFFVTGGYGLGAVFVKVNRAGEKWSAEITRTDAVASHIQSPVVCGKHLYVQSHKEHGGKASGLVCLDLDGNVKWATGPALQFDFGGYLLADGLIYAMDGKKGELHLLDADPAGFKALAKAKLLEPEGKNAWAPLALGDGKLIVRDQKKMKCVEVK